MNICDLIGESVSIGPSSQKSEVIEGNTDNYMNLADVGKIFDAPEIGTTLIAPGVNILIPRKAPAKPKIDEIPSSSDSQKDVVPAVIKPKPRGSTKFFMSVSSSEAADGTISHVFYKNKRIKGEDGSMETIQEYFRMWEEEIDGKIVTKTESVEPPKDEEMRKLVPEMEEEREVIDLDDLEKTDVVSENESEEDTNSLDDFVVDEAEMGFTPEDAEKYRYWTSWAAKVACPAFGDTTIKRVNEAALEAANSLKNGCNDDESETEKPRKKQKKEKQVVDDEIIVETLQKIFKGDELPENLAAVRLSLGLPEWEQEIQRKFVHEVDMNPEQEAPKVSPEKAIAKFAFKPRQKAVDQ